MARRVVGPVMLSLILGTFPLNAPAHAQRSAPIGVTVRRNAATTTWKTDSSLVRNDGWEQRAFWTWTGVGVVAGGIAGAIWAGVQIAHSDDPMLANLGIAIGVGAGAIAGGLLGAFSYTVSHSSNAQQ